MRVFYAIHSSSSQLYVNENDSIPVKMRIEITRYDKQWKESVDYLPVRRPVTLSSAIGQAISEDPRTPDYLMSIVHLSRSNPWADVIAGRAVEVWIQTGMPIEGRDFSKCRLLLANLSKGDFRQCDFSLCQIHTCNLLPASFDNKCRLWKADFVDCQTPKLLTYHYYFKWYGVTIIDLVTGRVRVVSRHPQDLTAFLYKQVVYAVSDSPLEKTLKDPIEPIREPLVRSTGLSPAFKRNTSSDTCDTPRYQGVFRFVPIDDRVIVFKWGRDEASTVRQGEFQTVELDIDRMTNYFQFNFAVVGHRIYFVRLSGTYWCWALICYDVDLDKWDEIEMPCFRFDDFCSVGNFLWFITADGRMFKYDLGSGEWIKGPPCSIEVYPHRKLVSHSGLLFSVAEHGAKKRSICWFDEDLWQWFGNATIDDIPKCRTTRAFPYVWGCWPLEWGEEKVEYDIRPKNPKKRRRREVELLAD